MSRDDYFVIKPYLTDGTVCSLGQNKDVIPFRDQRMVGIHGVDLAEAGDVAVFDIHARDIVFTLRFGLGAVLFQVVHCCGRHPQTGALAGADTGAGVVEAQHIAVDGVGEILSRSASSGSV